MNRFTKLWFGLAVLALGLTPARNSRAADCVTDLDCPGSECGGQVCQWLSTTSHVCQAAGGKSRGSDGWCNTSTDCKCQSLGAKCNAQFSCSFVQPSDAPAAGGAGGSGGNGGAAGASGGSGAASAGTGGTPAAGSSGSAAAGSENGGATTSGGASVGGSAASGDAASRPDGPITGAPSAPEAGGCALELGTVPRPGVSALLGLFAGASLVLRRKKHSAHVSRRARRAQRAGT